MNEPTDVEKLILAGALEPAAIDKDTGEVLYSFTSKLEEVSPELHKKLTNSIMSATMHLWELGFLNMDLTDPDPIISLTEKAYDENELSKLDFDLRRFLEDARRGLE